MRKFILKTNIDPIAYSTQSTFGLVTRPIVWSNTYCQHWNKDIHHCSKTEYPDFDCASTNVAGVRCTEGMEQTVLQCDVI